MEQAREPRRRLNTRVNERGVDHAYLQLERLTPAMRIVGQAIERGQLTAVALLTRMIDRLDKRQTTVMAKRDYGPEERERLLDKISRVFDNLQPAAEANAATDGSEK